MDRGKWQVTVRGKRGAPRIITVEAADEIGAINAAMKEGTVLIAPRPISVEAPSETAPEPEKSMAFLVISFLIPVVGLLIGSVRLGNRDDSGVGAIVAAGLGSLFWFLIFLQQ